MSHPQFVANKLKMFNLMRGLLDLKNEVVAFVVCTTGNTVLHIIGNRPGLIDSNWEGCVNR